MINPEWFTSLTLCEMATKLNSNDFNYKNEMYCTTKSGKIDHATLYVAKIAKNYWNEHKGEPLLVSHIKKEYKFGHAEWIPSAILKLRNLGMFKLGMKETVVSPGENWAENDQENE